MKELGMKISDRWSWLRSTPRLKASDNILHPNRSVLPSCEIEVRRKMSIPVGVIVDQALNSVYDEVEDMIGTKS